MFSKFLELLQKLGPIIAEYGPEGYALFLEIVAAYQELGPKLVDFLKRVLAEFQGDTVTLMGSLESEFPEVAEFYDRPRAQAIGDGRLFKVILEFIKNNPELIGIIIGLLEAEESNGGE